MLKRFTLLLAVCVAIPLIANSQNKDAQKILDHVRQTQQEQLEGIQDLTIETEDAVKYQKWENAGGDQIFKFRNEQEIMGQTQITVYDGTYLYTKNQGAGEVTKVERNLNPLDFFNSLEEMDPQYAGEETINGNPCHVLKITDMAMEDMINPTTGEKVVPEGTQGLENATIDATFYIDKDQWVFRKMAFKAKGMMMQGRERSASSIMEMKDYSDRDGYLMPYKTVTQMEVDMTEEEKKQMEEARRSMEEMKEKMKDMPESEQKMMKQHMEPQMKKMQENMLFSGQMEQVEKVKEVKTNSGLSDDLFDGSNL